MYRELFDSVVQRWFLLIWFVLPLIVGVFVTLTARYDLVPTHQVPVSFFGSTMILVGGLLGVVGTVWGASKIGSLPLLLAVVGMASFGEVLRGVGFLILEYYTYLPIAPEIVNMVALFLRHAGATVVLLGGVILLVGATGPGRRRGLFTKTVFTWGKGRKEP